MKREAKKIHVAVDATIWRETKIQRTSKNKKEQDFEIHIQNLIITIYVECVCTFSMIPSVHDFVSQNGGNVASFFYFPARSEPHRWNSKTFHEP